MSALRTVVRQAAPSRRQTDRRRIVLFTVGAGGLVLAFGALILLGAAVMLFAPLGSDETDPTCEPGGTSGGVSGALSSDELDDDQLGNAQTIMETGEQLGVPEYGWVIALATAMQESTLRNIPYGDRDSIGLFQQRTDWGSRSDRLDPEQSTTMFFTGGDAGQAGLLDINGWEDMPVTVAAQAVQRSAFPDAYADDEPLARELVAQYGGSSLGDDCGPPTAMCPPTPWGTTEAGLTPDALIVLRCTHEEWPQFTTFFGVGERPAGGDGDHAAGRAVDMMIPYEDYRSSEATTFGWKVAEWLRQNQEQFGIKYLIYDKKIWSVAHNDEGWRDYDHYSGCSSDTCLHYDHIHASVYGDAASLPDTGDWALPIQEGDYRLTARFGECSENWENCHTGLDFAAPSGTPVLAANGGTVTAARETEGPYGTVVVIDHGEGVETYYAHLSAISPRDLEGRQVEPGMMIGEVGSTGNSTGPHLHFEVRQDGTPVDPETWLEAHGLDP